MLIQRAAESTRESLTQSRTDFDSLKETLESRITELKTTLDDCRLQNSLLHTQLETVSAQALEIQQGNADVQVTEQISNLNGLVKHVRQEKDIALAQVQLLQSQHARLLSQNNTLQKSLGELRSTLEQERKRAMEALGSDKALAELKEKIEQVNILKESNANLRLEFNSRLDRITQLEALVEKKDALIEPLKSLCCFIPEELADLKGQLESKLVEISTLKEDNTRWRERVNQILAKYDRIDPEAHAALQTQVATLLDEKTKFDATVEQLRKEVETQKDLVAKGKGFIAQFRAARDEAVAEKTALALELSKKADSNVVKEKEAELLELKNRNSDLIARSNANMEKAKNNVADLKKQLSEAGELTKNAELENVWFLLTRESIKGKDKSY